MRNHPRRTAFCCAAFFSFTVAVVWLAPTALAIQRAEQGEIALIKTMEDERVQAGVRKDTDIIAAATADDYVQIDLEGNILGKTEAMQRIRSNRIQLQSNTLDEMNVRIYGNTAVVTARSTAKGTIDGAGFPRVRYSRVYVKRDGQWKVVMFQLTRIAAEQ